MPDPGAICARVIGSHLLLLFRVSRVFKYIQSVWCFPPPPPPLRLCPSLALLTSQYDSVWSTLASRNVYTILYFQRVINPTCIYRFSLGPVYLEICRETLLSVPDCAEGLSGPSSPLDVVRGATDRY